MNERTCASCEHWSAERDDFRQVVEAEYDAKWNQTAESVDRDQAYGACTAVPMGPVGAKQALPLAIVLDGSEYFAQLFTRAEFGCALHAPAATGDAS